MSWRTRRAAKDNEVATHITFKMKHVPASHSANQPAVRIRLRIRMRMFRTRGVTLAHTSALAHTEGR